MKGNKIIEYLFASVIAIFFATLVLPSFMSTITVSNSTGWNNKTFLDIRNLLLFLIPIGSSAVVMVVLIVYFLGGMNVSDGETTSDEELKEEDEEPKDNLENVGEAFKRMEEENKEVLVELKCEHCGGSLEEMKEPYHYRCKYCGREYIHGRDYMNGRSQ